MNPTTPICDLNQLEALLQCELDDDGERQVMAHLGECESCRLELESRAAETASWEEAKAYLTQRKAESGTQDDNSPPARQPLQIQHVLDALAPTDDPEMLGRIGGYEVSGVVGNGGMGVVLKAFDKSLDRTVAIKVMAPHLASSGAARKRFAREAKAAAAVLHPNVMAIHSVSGGEPLPFLVMPYMRGSSLQKRLDAEGPLSTGEILRIAAQTAAGLAAAHAQGLVHRDIKPANILLEEGVERVAITDFGLARAVDDASMTRTGVVAGTPQYMSPEQARGESVDQRSDLFSLGSVLYAMCTCHPPFRAESSYGVLRRITDDEPKPIREINPEIPEWLCAIVDKLMSKCASDRYQSAAEVAELLEDCLAHVQQPATVPLPDSVAPRPTIGRGRPPLVRLLVAAAFAFSLIFAGILIVLELNKGKLTIKSEADDVPIRIMQGDKVVENLTVSKSGNTIRIAAGHYRVEIDGDIDGIIVADGTVTLKRGGQQAVKIVRFGRAELAAEPSAVQQLPMGSRRLVAAFRNAQLRRETLLKSHGARHPEVLKLDAEIKAIEDSISRLDRVATSADPPTRGNSVTIEVPEDPPGVIILRGQKDEVVAVQEAIQAFERAAGGLQGEWDVIAITENGNPAPPKLVASVGFRIDGEKLIPIMNGEAQPRDAAVLKLNDATNPKQIDVIRPSPHNAAFAIYELAGDRLRICTSDVERPRSFEANAKGVTLMVLERVKPNTGQGVSGTVPTPDFVEAMLSDPHLEQAVNRRAAAQRTWRAANLRATKGEATLGEEAAAREAYLRRCAEVQAALTAFYERKADSFSLNARIRRLLLQRAAERGLTVSDDEVTSEKQRIVKKFGIAVDALERMIEEERGITAKQWGRDVIEPHLLLRKLSGGEENVTAYHEELRRQVQRELEDEMNVGKEPAADGAAGP